MVQTKVEEVIKEYREAREKYETGVGDRETVVEAYANMRWEMVEKFNHGSCN
jgi:hypothetical protein